MNRKLSAISTYRGLNEWLDQHCKENQFSSWHHYGPAEVDGYFASTPRVMIVNSESSGYDDVKGAYPDEYITWIKDGWATPRYGSVLISAIIRRITELDTKISSGYERQLYQDSYQNVDGLLNMMCKVAYVNARVSSNDSGTMNEQKSQVVAEAKLFALYRKRLIELLDPEIIICGGSSARDAIFQIDGFYPVEVTPNLQVSRIGDRIIVLIPHLSRPSLFGGYEHLDVLAEQCAKLYHSSLNKKKQNKSEQATPKKPSD
jgi:hypothetical protein